MKKILSVILILALVLSLGACKKSAPDPAAELRGTWEAQVDLAAYLKEKIVLSNQELKDTLNLSKYPATLILELKEDGSYQRTLKGAFEEAAIATLRAELTAGYTAYYTAFLKNKGMDMSVAEFEKTTGVSLAAKVNQVADSAYLKAILTDIDRGGTYEVQEGTIAFGGFASAGEPVHHTYTLEADALTLSECDAPGDLEEAFYPLTFQKK